MPGSERWGGRELLYGSRLGAVLPAVPLTEHHGRCEEHDLQVLERRAMADVLEIVVELLPDVFYAAIVRQVDLGPAGDPRQDALAPLVLRYLLTQLGKDRGLLGARADHVHIAHQDVPELGQLVQPELAQYASYRGDARIVALRPHLRRCSAVRPHRAQLVHDERPAAVIRMAPGIACRLAERAAIEADPLLREQHRTRGCKLDQHRDDDQYRQGDHRP